MSRTIYYIEIAHQDGHKERGFYTSMKALWIDNKEILPVSKSYMEKHDWKNPVKKDNVLILKSTAYTTSEVEKFNWVDRLPPEIGAESFE